MSDDDPFDEFERPDDEADPFEDLDGPDERDGDDGEPEAGDRSGGQPGRLPDDPFSDRDTAGPERPSNDEPTDAGGDRATDEEPVETLGSRIDESAVDGDAADPFADLGGGPQPRVQGDDAGNPFEAFESVDVDGVDPDEVWANLASLEDTADEFDGRVYYEVSKHRFCEQCPHFTGPPDSNCTFDGADIVEFVDMETVRLVNCPVVAEQEDLGEDVTRYEAE